jgi:hypothetical protein
MFVPYVALLAACGDGPTEHSHDEPEAHGVLIRDGGTTLVTVDDGVVTGSLAVPDGDETPNYDIVFTDHDGDPITSGLAEFEVGATVANTGVAIFHSVSAFQAHFEGIAVGSTTVVIQLIHTADGDSHYDSPAIDVDVS